MNVNFTVIIMNQIRGITTVHVLNNLVSVNNVRTVNFIGRHHRNLARVRVRANNVKEGATRKRNIRLNNATRMMCGRLPKHVHHRRRLLHLLNYNPFCNSVLMRTRQNREFVITVNRLDDVTVAVLRTNNNSKIMRVTKATRVDLRQRLANGRVHLGKACRTIVKTV